MHHDFVLTGIFGSIAFGGRGHLLSAAGPAQPPNAAALSLSQRDGETATIRHWSPSFSHEIYVEGILFFRLGLNSVARNIANEMKLNRIARWTESINEINIQLKTTRTTYKHACKDKHWHTHVFKNHGTRRCACRHCWIPFFRTPRKNGRCSFRIL